MPLPEIEPLADAISGLRVVRDSDGHARAAWRIEQLAEQPLSVRSLSGRVGEELARAGHPVNDEISDLVLMLAISLAGGRSRLAALNAALESASPWQVKQRFVLPGPPPPDYEFRLGEFWVGELESAFEADCARLNSDAFARHRSRLQGNLTFHREAVPLVLLDWQGVFPLTARGVDEQLCDDLWEGYLSAVADSAFQEFFQALHREQEILVALGESYLDGDALQVPGSMRISMLEHSDAGRAGFVRATTRQDPRLDLGDTFSLGRAIEALSLRRRHRPELADDEVQQLILTAAHFISSARSHSWAGRMSEALLNFVIALEVLFGERQDVGASIERRAAAFLSDGDSGSYGRLRKEVSRVYNSRSRFVHDGKRVAASDVDTAQALCTSTLERLLYNGPVGDRSTFRRGLDAVAACIEQGWSIEEANLMRLGVVSPETKSS